MRGTVFITLLVLTVQAGVFAQTPAPSPEPGVNVPGLGLITGRVGFSRTEPRDAPNPDQSVSAFRTGEDVYSYVILRSSALSSDVSYGVRARWLREGGEAWQWRGSRRAQQGWTSTWWWSSPPRNRYQPGSWAVEWFVNDVLVARGTFRIQ